MESLSGLVIFGIGIFLGAFGWPRLEHLYYRRCKKYSVFRVYFNNDGQEPYGRSEGRFADFIAFGDGKRRELYTNLLAHQKCRMLWTAGGSIKRFEVVEGVNDYLPYERYLSEDFSE